MCAAPVSDRRLKPNDLLVGQEAVWLQEARLLIRKLELGDLLVRELARAVDGWGKLK